MKIKKKYSVSEIADMLGVTTQCIRNYIKEKILHANRESETGRWFVYEHDLNAFLKKNRKKKEKPKRKPSLFNRVKKGLRLSR